MVLCRSIILPVATYGHHANLIGSCQKPRIVVEAYMLVQMLGTYQVQTNIFMQTMQTFVPPDQHPRGERRGSERGDLQKCDQRWTVHWMLIMQLRLEVCKVAQRDQFALDTFPFIILSLISKKLPKQFMLAENDHDYLKIILCEIYN